MASLQIRDMPEELYQSLKARAEKDHRSLAQQALVLLSEALYPETGGNNRRISALARIRNLKKVEMDGTVDILEMLREDRER